jgi:hypothetical protein
MPPAWRSALSPVGFGENGGTLITAGRLPASRAVVWLLPFLVSPHDVWDPAPCQRVGTLDLVGGDFARDAWNASGESRL